MPRVDWLDAHVDRQINQREHAQAGGDEMILYVDLPTYSMPVVYAESDGKSAQDIATPQESVIEPSFFTIFDPEAASENLFEAKHRRLVRSQHASLADRERKPTAAVRDALMVCGELTGKYFDTHLRACSLQPRWTLSGRSATF